MVLPAASATVRVCVAAPQVALWLSWSPAGETRKPLRSASWKSDSLPVVLPTSDSVIEVENAGPVISAMRLTTALPSCPSPRSR